MYLLPTICISGIFAALKNCIPLAVARRNPTAKITGRPHYRGKKKKQIPGECTRLQFRTLVSRKLVDVGQGIYK